MRDETARKLFAGPCDFIWGASRIDNLPPQSLKEVAFVGRSNVGKSSLINALTGRKTVARVSQTPGRTQQINFFNLGGRLMLVDLPGYGYAKASKSLAMEWQTLTFAYMSGRATLARVALLIDSRRGPQDEEFALAAMVRGRGLELVFAATKADKIRRSERAAMMRLFDLLNAPVFPCSTLDGEGLDALRQRLFKVTRAHGVTRNRADPTA